MGGLAMPNVPIKKDEVKALIHRHGNIKVVIS